MKHPHVHPDVFAEKSAIRPVFSKKEGALAGDTRARFVRGSWRGFDGNVEVVTHDRARHLRVSLLSFILLYFQ